MTFHPPSILLQIAYYANRLSQRASRGGVAKLLPRQTLHSSRTPTEIVKWKRLIVSRDEDAR
jgi:hypothetical protein